MDEELWMRILALCSLMLMIQGEDATISIVPKYQKVAEYSPVVFTCMVTGDEEGTFMWYRTGRPEPLDEVKDDVTIKMLDNKRSVLKIERTDIKKHKRSYLCRFQSEERTIESSAELKVLPRSRLHKYFPHITPISADGGSAFREGPEGTITLQCSVSIKKNLPKWRWIKDGFEDMALNDENEGRILVSQKGELIITEATPDDSGMYMCVAENNRGTAYGNQIKISVIQEPQVFTSCTDGNGYVSTIGESYAMSGDICTTCVCEEGGILRCRSVSCFPYCPGGLTPKMSETECCKYECVSDEDVESVEHDEDHCLDGNNNVVNDGDLFQPDRNDPCKTCLCEDGFATGCSVKACAPPNCLGYMRVPGTCCEFICPEGGERIRVEDGTCKDRDGRTIMSGDVFLPDEDPCKKCVCENGRMGGCMMVACKAPHCANFTPSRDKCCDYTCHETPELPRLPVGIQDGCRSYNGSLVREGDIFQPDKNPCNMCECFGGDEGHGNCEMVTCDEPTCRNYRLIPGTCCGFICPDEEEVETVSINLDAACKAFNGTLAPHGSNYQPTSDVCYHCTCMNGEPQDCGIIQACAYGPLPPKPHDNDKAVLGRVVMQQTGRNDAMIQWSLPEEYQDLPAVFTVTYTDPASSETHSMVVKGDTHLILKDLEINTMYDVRVNGYVGDMPFSAIPTPFRFTLKARGHSSLELNNALGQVFMSRGSIAYDGYSLPRKFEPVSRDNNVDVLLNVKSFHMIELSTYNEAPCPDQNCGLIRFYMYGIDGEAQNVMSLMFSSHQDFNWAKAHL